MAQKVGRGLFSVRSLTPVPVVGACGWLIWAGHGAVGPGGAGLDAALDVVGLGLALAGQALRFLTLGTVPEGTSGQDLSLQASTLNTRGPYARVRNPLYVGNLLITLGLLCVANSPWVYGLGLTFFFGEYFFIIRAEEAFLRARFGASYDEYCAKVSRWVPRLGKAYEGALRGGGFDWVRAVKKEINPFTAWVSGALALYAFEWWARGGGSTRIWAVLCVECVALMALVVVKAWKKGWLFA